MKKILSIILLAVCCLHIMVVMVGCKEEKLEEVTLSVWCSGEDIEFVEKTVESFKKKYEGEAIFNITISEEGEISCKESVLANPGAAADVFAFASDQYKELHDAGALLEVTLNADDVIKANGGANNGAVSSALTDGKLFAYPMSSSNGYFLYYNTNYLSEEDIKSFDRILEVAEKNGKKVTMDYTSGWYIYSFFKGAGLNVELNPDGVTNSCDWNSTSGKYTGVDVAEAMLNIVRHPAFVSGDDDTFKSLVKNGEIIAGINGAWNSGVVKEAFGDGYGAAKLPEFTIKDSSVQMCSFMGYKLMGINSATDFPQWSMRLAQWLTNENSQIEHFKVRGEAPSNINAAKSPEVLNSPAIRALSEQSAYGYVENVGGAFWQPAYVFGTTIAADNPDNIDLQQLLDIMVREIESAPEAN